MMLTDGQAYHFSQGWLPGGKRSPAAVHDLSRGSDLARLVRAEYRRRTAVMKSADSYSRWWAVTVVLGIARRAS